MTRLTLSEVNSSGVVLIPEQTAKGLFARFQRSAMPDLTQVNRDDQALAYALARVRSLDQERDQSIIRPDRLTLSHRLVSQLEDTFTEVLGLPPLVADLSFAARMRGTLGSSDAKLEWWWERNGRKESVPRSGAVLFPELPDRRQRVSHAVLEAIRLAEEFDPTAPVEEHWRALAGFRTLLGQGSGATLDPFLDGLKIVSVSRLGIEVTEPDTHQFAPFPMGKNQDSSPFSPGNIKSFQSAVQARGAQPAFRLDDGTFAVIDGSAQPVLEIMADAMKGDTEARRMFIQDAPRLIADAIEHQMRNAGQIDEQTAPEAAAELIERKLEEGWAETDAWSDRVIGVGVALPVPDEIDAGSGLPWLPSTVSLTIGEVLGGIADDDVQDVLSLLKRAVLSGDTELVHEAGVIPVRPDVIEALTRRLAMLVEPAAPETDPADAYLPIVHDNLHDLDYFADATQRQGAEADLPASVATSLRGYQSQAFQWQVQAWKAGLPGVLNADEQGLGKTLQTLSFLAWLSQQMQDGIVQAAPTLIVAPTSLLRNWQAEIDEHLEAEALGKVHRLYGTGLSRWREAGARGRDIGDGKAHLDLGSLVGTSDVIITTYQTLANFAVSFAGLKFAVAVFDEMQFIKNPRTQRAQAAKALHSEFVIGLTGTPIENKTQDLWSILDVISPGALGSLARFNRVFGAPSDVRLQQLQSALFDAGKSRPALCQRRTKTQADPSIPPKIRLMYPREMPPAQAIRYDEARAKTGGILQVLQHIRRVSAHPGLIETEGTNDFVAASARVRATIDILRFIKSKGERALVFVENRDIQAWFIEILNLEFDLEFMLINGSTPIDERQRIKEHFQRDREEDRGFDVLVLGPRAAGTGLTLTAANHVIHLTRWWNPAVEEQCNDRTHRIGQTRPVTVHLPMAVHPELGPASFDCLLHRLITRKIGLASNVLQSAQVDDQDLKKLFDASVSGRVVDDAPREHSLRDNLPGREDLNVVALSENVIRIESENWPNRVLVSVDSDCASLSEFVDEQTDHVVLIEPSSSDIEWTGRVPLSLVNDKRLWPDFIAPF